MRRTAFAVAAVLTAALALASCTTTIDDSLRDARFPWISFPDLDSEGVEASRTYVADGSHRLEGDFHVGLLSVERIAGLSMPPAFREISAKDARQAVPGLVAAFESFFARDGKGPVGEDQVREVRNLSVKSGPFSWKSFAVSYVIDRGGESSINYSLFLFPNGHYLRVNGSAPAASGPQVLKQLSSWLSHARPFAQ
jgi:hypothetical protein